MGTEEELKLNITDATIMAGGTTLASVVDPATKDLDVNVNRTHRRRHNSSDNSCSDDEDSCTSSSSEEDS